ncbi:BsuPI-related putative proteinase inhibitor [Bacillus salacetis]|uniref:BsuPI-related putative proteinase inhibitor n=1 Tax=Bacillus salacetis TaxID=2315464 RepID=UPI001444773C|nr:BsuPI-related putative proteinase inhibitor [Bacillus salacetis]
MNLFIILLSLYCLPGGTLAQQPDWDVEITGNPESADLQFRIFNNTPAEMVLEFPTSQFYDYEVRDHAGNKVYRYSDNKAFLQAVQRVRVKSGETKIWRDQWKYTSSDGKRIPSGKYTIHASLMVKNINGTPVNIDFTKNIAIAVAQENPSFRHVELSKNDGSFQIKGEAKVSAGSFYYTVEDGHHMLKEETLVKVNKEYPNWVPFDFAFKIDTGQFPKDRPVLVNLYERDLKEGTIHHNYTLRLN